MRWWDEDAQERTQLKSFAKKKYNMKRTDESKQGDTTLAKAKQWTSADLYASLGS